MKLIILGFATLLVAFVGPLQAEEKPGPIRPDPRVFQPPKVSDAPGFEEEGLKAIFYEGVPYHGKPSRVFAWLGIPKTPTASGRFPAMVLVHGGGGTAFAKWVRLWTDRGYVAIAMDTCGQLPRGNPKHWDRDPQGGPPGWGGFDQVNERLEDQWSYQAISDVILANSLLRSLPQVDPDRIGLTGISWGGYLTCIVAGLDTRFKFAAPVYGCGFLGEDSAWLTHFQKMGPNAAEGWLGTWDPSVYLAGVKMPTLWVDGTNDSNYPLESLQKSYRLVPGPRTLCIRVLMPHNHSAGQTAPEIFAFADGILRGGKPLAQVTEIGREGENVWTSYNPSTKIAKAEFNFTRDDGPWPKRKWWTRAATVHPDEARVDVELPPGARVCYFNLIDDKGLIVSTDYVELK